MVNKQDLAIGHQVHSPMHNRFDAIRDETVFNNINQSDQVSSAWSQSAASRSLNKLKHKLSGQTHGLTTQEINSRADPRSRVEGG